MTTEQIVSDEPENMDSLDPGDISGLVHEEAAQLSNEGGEPSAPTDASGAPSDQAVAPPDSPDPTAAELEALRMQNFQMQQILAQQAQKEQEEAALLAEIEAEPEQPTHQMLPMETYQQVLDNVLPQMYQDEADRAQARDTLLRQHSAQLAAIEGQQLREHVYDMGSKIDELHTKLDQTTQPQAPDEESLRHLQSMLAMVETQAQMVDIPFDPNSAYHGLTSGTLTPAHRQQLDQIFQGVTNQHALPQARDIIRNNLIAMSAGGVPQQQVPNYGMPAGMPPSPSPSSTGQVQGQTFNDVFELSAAFNEGRISADEYDAGLDQLNGI